MPVLVLEYEFKDPILTVIQKEKEEILDSVIRLRSRYHQDNQLDP